MLSDRAPIVEMREIVFPHHANHYGTLFGGQALAWMDKAAFLVATELCDEVVVTARSEAVDFLTPVRVGDLVRLQARVVEQGRRSLRVAVDLFVRGQELPATRGVFVMVRMGQPVA